MATQIKISCCDALSSALLLLCVLSQTHKRTPRCSLPDAQGPSRSRQEQPAPARVSGEGGGNLGLRELKDRFHYSESFAWMLVSWVPDSQTYLLPPLSLQMR